MVRSEVLHKDKGHPQVVGLFLRGQDRIIALNFTKMEQLQRGAYQRTPSAKNGHGEGLISESIFVAQYFEKQNLLDTFVTY
jgi:hypothetical protein